MADALDVCALDDLPEAVPTVVKIGRRELVLVNWRGRVYAIRNVCPHMLIGFERGVVAARATGVVGDVAFDEDDPTLVCPWHSFEFSLTTGACRADPKLRARTYPTRVERGRVFVDVA
jgi:nitrite reductase/ring-hydroxylating ferredoxin subunit